MPTYDYKCTSCGHTFELFQYMTEEPLTECPKCHGKVERLIGVGAGLIFKGNGFYITDHRSDSYKKAEKAEKSKPSSSDATKTEKSESTPTKKSPPDTAKKVTA